MIGFKKRYNQSIGKKTVQETWQHQNNYKLSEPSMMMVFTESSGVGVAFCQPAVTVDIVDNRLSMTFDKETDLKEANISLDTLEMFINSPTLVMFEAPQLALENSNYIAGKFAFNRMILESREDNCFTGRLESVGGAYYDGIAFTRITMGKKSENIR